MTNMNVGYTHANTHTHHTHTHTHTGPSPNSLSSTALPPFSGGYSLPTARARPSPGPGVDGRDKGRNPASQRESHLSAKAKGRDGWARRQAPGDTQTPERLTHSHPERHTDTQTPVTP